jgi:type I restriction enzyme S subunit
LAGVELGDVCECAYGKSLPAKNRSGTGFPVYGSNGVVGFHNEVLTDGATIVAGRKGSFGEVHFSEEPCSPIDTTYFITAAQTNAYLPWLARRLRTLIVESVEHQKTRLRTHLAELDTLFASLQSRAFNGAL